MSDLLVEVAGRLAARTDELIERQLAVLRAFPAYERVPADDLRRSCRRNVQRVVRTLAQHTSFTEIEEDERASGRRRARQGVPVDSVVEAYRAVLAVLRDAFIDEATAAGADPRAVLAGTTQLWDLTDRYSGVLVSARQQVEIDSARSGEWRRMAFLHGLVGGGLEPAELAAGATAHGLTAERFWVVRTPTGDPVRMTRHLEQGGPGLAGPLDDDVVGVTSSRPRPFDDAVIAVAGPVPLAEVPAAFTEATQVLVAALRYHRSGVVDRSTLSVRVAVEHEAELGERLRHRYLAALEAAGAGAADLLTTLATWLRERRSVAATARVLTVHENTVRYRLARFEELAGADLGDTDVLVEVWWAVEYSAVRPG